MNDGPVHLVGHFPKNVYWERRLINRRIINHSISLSQNFTNFHRSHRSTVHYSHREDEHLLKRIKYVAQHLIYSSRKCIDFLNKYE